MTISEEFRAFAEGVWEDLATWGQGRDEAMTRETLRRRCDCTDRALRRAVAHLRSIGRPIGFEPRAPGGYYVITDPADLRRMEEQFRKRLVAAAVALAGLRKGGVGQQVLDLLGEDEHENEQGGE